MITVEILEECESLFNKIREKALHNNQMAMLGKATGCFDTHNVEHLRKLNKSLDLGIELHELQSHCNNGRGVSCVRQVAGELMRGSENGARAISHNDWDKIANYPSLAKWLKEHNLAEQSWYVDN